MLCCASMMAALVITWERSAVLACCLGLFWLVRKYISTPKQIIAFAVVLFCIFGVFFVRSNGPVNATSAMRSVQSRAELLHAGTLMFTHHWLNGVGVGCLSLPIPVTMHDHTENIQMIDPYNQYLYWLDEMGVFGGVLTVLLGVFVYKTIASSSSDIGRAVAAVWISVVIAGLFNTLFGCYGFSCGNMLFGSLLGMTMLLGNYRDVPLCPISEEQNCNPPPSSGRP